MIYTLHMVLKVSGTPVRRSDANMKLATLLALSVTYSYVVSMPRSQLASPATAQVRVCVEGAGAIKSAI